MSAKRNRRMGSELLDADGSVEIDQLGDEVRLVTEAKGYRLYLREAAARLRGSGGGERAERGQGA